MDSVAVAGFRLWDAPAAGSPRPDGVSSQWSARELHTVTLGRCHGAARDDLPDIAVSTMKPEASVAPHHGLTVNALLSFAPRLMAAAAMTPREAAETLVRLGHGPGVPSSLTVGGRVIDARRYEVPATADWVVTGTVREYPVCVAGRGGLAVPPLEPADMTRWVDQLRDQMREVTGAP